MSKSKKAVLLVCAFIAVIMIGVIVLYTDTEKRIEAYNDFEFSNLDLSSVEDGTYTGSEDGGIVKASVEVKVVDHIITDVKIISHRNGRGKPAEVIANDVVAKNTIDVDVVSGATLSSSVIKMAIYNALTK